VLAFAVTVMCIGNTACRTPPTTPDRKTDALQVPAYTRTTLPFPKAQRPVAAAAADVDGNGIVDIVAVGPPRAKDGADTGIARVYLFTRRHGYRIVDIPTTRGIRGVAAADLDGDGAADIVTANGASKSVSIFGGVKGHAAVNRTDRPTDYEPMAVAIADLNGDGRPDLTTASENGTIGISINNGNHDFGPWRIRSGARTAAGLLVADADNDGVPDVLIPQAEDGTIGLFLRGKHGGWKESQTADVAGRHPDGLAVADFNGDGVEDLAVSVFERGSVHILAGTGEARFRLWVRLGVGPAPNHVATADLNRDGRADLIVTTNKPDRVILLYGTSDPGFASVRPLRTGDTPVDNLTADLNGDGLPDVVVVNSEDNSLTLLASNAKNTWSALSTPNGPFGGGPVVSGAAPLYEDALAAFKKGNYFGALRRLRRVHAALAPEFAIGRLVDGHHEEERRIYLASVLLMSDVYRYYTGEARSARDLESELAATAARIGQTALAAGEYLSLCDIEREDLDDEGASIQALIRLEELTRQRPAPSPLVRLLSDTGKLRIDRLHQGFKDYRARLPSLRLPYPVEIPSAELRTTLLPHLDAYGERAAGAARYEAFARTHPRTFRAVVAEYLFVRDRLATAKAAEARMLGLEFSRRYPTSLLALVAHGDVSERIQALGDRKQQTAESEALHELADHLGVRVESDPR